MIHPAEHTPVRPSRQTITDANKEKLLAAGRKLFSTQGLAGTQISQITAEAGTGISMFYRHFKDKKELLNHLLEAFLDELDEKLAGALEGVESQTPLEQLFTIRRVFEEVIGQLVSNPELTVMLYRAGFAADEETERMVRQRISKVAMDIAAHVTRAEEAGIVVVKQKEVLGHAATGLALQVSNKLILEGEPSLTEAVDTCTRFTIGGLLVFCPPDTFNEIFPAIRYMLQPTSGPASETHPNAEV